MDLVHLSVKIYTSENNVSRLRRMHGYERVIKRKAHDFAVYTIPLFLTTLLQLLSVSSWLGMLPGTWAYVSAGAFGRAIIVSCHRILSQ